MPVLVLYRAARNKERRLARGRRAASIPRVTPSRTQLDACAAVEGAASSDSLVSGPARRWRTCDADGAVESGLGVYVPAVVPARAGMATLLAVGVGTGVEVAGVIGAAWEMCCAAGASDLRAQVLASGLPDVRFLATESLDRIIRLG